MLILFYVFLCFCVCLVKMIELVIHQSERSIIEQMDLWAEQGEVVNVRIQGMPYLGFS